ncbi:MAG: thioesterase family protein [Betaproteobacteria bacterium]
MTDAPRKESRPDDTNLVHTEMMPIRWGDMDAMMHVNNTVYFRYMEQARISWMDTWASSGGADAEEGPVVATASCQFRRPLKYPGSIEIRLFAGRIGRSSLPTYYEIRRTDDPDTVYATGDALFVWISNVTGKPVSFPDELRRRLK